LLLLKLNPVDYPPEMPLGFLLLAIFDPTRVEIFVELFHPLFVVSFMLLEF